LLLYYITDRRQFAGSETELRQALLGRVAEAARCGVDFIQLREKDLSARDLEILAHPVVQVICASSVPPKKMRLLINSRADVAIAVGADGVHLRSQDVLPRDMRSALGSARSVVGVSCHTVDEVARAEAEGADFAVFGPVFGKADAPELKPAGLELLAEACRNKIPVLALGGVTVENAAACLQAGAAGVAGIRLFQQGTLEETVARLRACDPS
jgi:thiamine-phosphate pyrophosphorylase